ncbi:DUF2663 family protein [Sporolactobacillus terrae]|uniref:DUF2663 domain-containing protein n=1 Tax=Sporolactobacillus terrae TaxID=269673 RepID=A0A410D972_9BACL|nr:DUF2663 family protein [Sporolactobacillus terrae]QAA22636.1 DUF2663 domain-containing protein [Sporolactobacillus terrae]QAA25610.1 DUF2663 domain-containing protein [Sporolactobacillus terrae]UAK17419.1 YpbF family protein [Sporolactobacillus terrae]BBN98963.1 hypothetical protein St703_16680 [Sporolactobacillus terrae]
MSLKEYRDNGQISGVLFTILTEMIKRKKAKERWARREAAAGFSLMLCAGIVVVYAFLLNDRAIRSIHDFYMRVTQPFSASFLFLSLLLLLVFSYTHSEREDADDDYDDLKDEIIERTDELWTSEEADVQNDTIRFHVLTFLKKEFDINLFYK